MCCPVVIVACAEVPGNCDLASEEDGAQSTDPRSIPAVSRVGFVPTSVLPNSAFELGVDYHAFGRLDAEPRRPPPPSPRFIDHTDFILLVLISSSDFLKHPPPVSSSGNLFIPTEKS